MLETETNLLQGDLMEDATDLTLGQLCRACRVPAEVVIELVELGLVEPVGGEPGAWRFPYISVRRVRCAQRLQRDLEVNMPGAALAIELLEELDRLRARLRQIDPNLDRY